MGDLSFALAVIVWGVLPGLALLYALNPAWSPVERVAAAAGLSLAVVAFSAYAAELLGLPIAPAPVLALVALLCGVVVLLRKHVGSARVDATPLRKDEAPGVRPSWAPWLVLLLPLAIVSQLEFVATMSLLPPSLHDGLDHANWFRLIYETRSLNPQEVLAPPLGPDGAPSYYPWGLHAWIALIAQTTALDPVAVLIRSLMLTSAAIPLSVYVFTAHLTGRGWTAMAAATLSLAFWWLPYQVWGWGGYPLLAGAVAALPLCRLALSVVDDWRLAGIAAAGVCAIGVLVIHPSQAMLALIAACVVSTTLAASRALPWRAALPFLLMLGAAGLLLALGAGLWGPVGAFMEHARAIGAQPAWDPRYAWPLGVYFDNTMLFPIGSRIAFGALCVIGAGVALVHARTRPLLVLHVVLSLLIPLARHETWLTGLWYHMPERLWYAQYACLPALAGVGVAGSLQVLGRAVRRWVNLTRWQYVVWPLTLWLVMGSFGGAYADWMRVRLQHYAYHNPNLTITDRRVLADVAWMREHVPGGDVVFNAPADWGVLLPFTGHRTVFWSGGYAIDPSTNWNRLLHLLRRGEPFTSHAAAALASRNIRYVYVASFSDPLAVGGRLSLDGAVLRHAAGFELLYESPTAMVFRTRDEGAVLLGLEDSDRIAFEGFYGIEELNGREWRWSGGIGRLRIRPPTDQDRECFVRLFGTDPDKYRLTVDGQALESTPWGFRLAPDQRRDDVYDIALVPATPMPATGSAGDARELGLRVTNVSIVCPSSSEDAAHAGLGGNALRSSGSAGRRSGRRPRARAVR